MLEFLLGNSFLLSVIAFAIILIPAIIIHELGHFFAAKMVGINVLEFGIGFPPRAMRLFTWGETEFTLNWLPIGGFVRPLGEDMVGPVAEDMSDDPYLDVADSDDKAKNSVYWSEREELLSRGVPEDQLMSVNDAKPLARIWFMAAGAIANVVSAALMFMVAALLGIAIEVGTRVQLASVPSGSAFDQGEVVAGDAIELFNGAYFETYNDFFALWDDHQGEEVVLTMRHPDDYENEDLAGQRYEISVTPAPLNRTATVMVQFVAEESPAEAAGLLAGDLITAINSRAIDMENPTGDLIATTTEFAEAGDSITLTIQRDNTQFERTLTPRVDPPPGQGRVGIRIQSQWYTPQGLGFADSLPQFEMRQQSLGDSIAYGLTRTYDTLKLIAGLPGQIISGAISPEEARPVSVVGISQIGGEFLQRSIERGAPSMVLEFIALISIFLGITNLLPLPPLDGGRILFVLIEIVRGKPVPIHIENAIYRIGIALLLGLGVVIIIFDIFNPVSLP